MIMRQFPGPGEFLLKWCGDNVKVAVELDCAAKGRAVLRTDLGNAAVQRGEIIAETEVGEIPLAKAWRDLPLEEVAPGRFEGVFQTHIAAGDAAFYASV
jgi:hypothetical protein